MPHVSRMSSRFQAKQMRQSGELVTLLISSVDHNSDTSTPLDIVASNTAVDISSAIQVPIYAHVHWKALGDVKYEESGRARFSTAVIETSNQWSTYLQQCFAVQLDDGSIMRKESENLSDTKAIYTITVSGYVNIAQNV